MLNQASSLPNWGSDETKWLRPWWGEIDPPDHFYELKDDLMDKLGLREWENADRKRYSQLSIAFEHGEIHEHDHIYPDQQTESYYQEFVDARVNTLIQAPEAGAGLRVNNISFDPPLEGDSWTFNAFRKHSVNPVIGKKPRIVASFGFHMPKAAYRQFLEKHS